MPKSSIGQQALTGVCELVHSPLMVFVFIVAIVGIALALTLGPPQMNGKWSFKGSVVVQVVVGAAVITSLGFIIAALGFHGSISC